MQKLRALDINNMAVITQHKVRSSLIEEETWRSTFDMYMMRNVVMNMLNNKHIFVIL